MDEMRKREDEEAKHIAQDALKKNNNTDKKRYFDAPLPIGKGDESTSESGSSIGKTNFHNKIIFAR